MAVICQGRFHSIIYPKCHRTSSYPVDMGSYLQDLVVKNADFRQLVEGLLQADNATLEAILRRLGNPQTLEVQCEFCVTITSELRTAEK